MLQELVTSVQAIVEDNFIGAYLQGSFAVGDFDLHSDVDWIIAIDHELSDRQVQALQVMHERVFNLNSRWAKHLEGSYFPKEVLHDPSERGRKLWYLDNGSRSLIQSTHCNTSVVRWVVREQGITLAGPAPHTLIDAISADLLRKDIFENMITWGQEIINHPDSYNNRFYQGFVVLNYCRMLHDLHSGSTGSKLAGAEWVIYHLDPSWAGLIDRAWSRRVNPANFVRQPADPVDFNATLEFVQYAMHEGRLYMSNQGESSS